MNEISGEAYGKLNLSLDVTGRRADGYHLVRMVMQTVDITDTVTIVRCPGSREIEVTSDSGKIPSGPANLVWRAADVLRREYGLGDGLRIHIRKRIPVAAGMAGGSADAAAVLRLLRRMYGLVDASDAVLERLALPLGADIPYCIAGGTQLCGGIGEELTPLPAPPDCCLIVVKPDIDVPTKWAYQAFDGIPGKEVRHPDVDGMVRAIRAGDLKEMCRCFGNVLEQQTGAVYPVIGELERFLLRRGALGSIMTGSGPTVFAVFDAQEKAGAAFEELKTVPAYRDFLKYRTRFCGEAR